MASRSNVPATNLSASSGWTNVRLSLSERGGRIAGVALAFVVAVVGIAKICEDGATDAVLFGVLCTLFLMGAGAFLFFYGVTQGKWTSSPVLLTIWALIGFAAAPMVRFVSGDERVDTEHVLGMSIVLVGFSVFWLVARITAKNRGLIFHPDHSVKSYRVLISALGLLLVGIVARIIMIRLGLIAYLVLTLRYTISIPEAEALYLGSRALEGALLVSGIEVLGKRSKWLPMRVVFFLSLVLSIGFSLISGMKSDLLISCGLLVLIVGVTRRRLPKFAWLIPIAMMLTYPFVSAYRNNLNSGYMEHIDSVSGLGHAISISVDDTVSGRWASSDSSTDSSRGVAFRMSLLTFVHDVLQIHSPVLLDGDEKVWMAPFYPFLPRVLWEDKPVLNKGQRMSEAMGIGSISSTSVPAPVDMWLLGGFTGVIVGMAVWAFILQWQMNRFAVGISERGVFFFVVMLQPMLDMERDVVALVGTAIQMALIVLLISFLIYGGDLFRLRATVPTVKATHA